MTRRAADHRLEAARSWAAKRHTRISSFALFSTAGTGTYIEAEFGSLAEARSAAQTRTKAPGGHKVAICALTPEGWVFRLEDVSPG
ncbi:MAG: hypothetical protein JO128_24485 [Alphaproteobacteria bacterium]|nr:hypothetical protein [Alphaproteobacteria bacterium]